MLLGLMTIWPLMRQTWPPLFDSSVACTGFEAFSVVLIATQHQSDFAADKLVEQLCRIQQIVLIILLENSQARGGSQRGEMNRLWPNLRGYIGEPQSYSAHRKCQPARFLTRPRFEL